MLASVIHEFWTPINSMQANVEKIKQDENLKPETHEKLKIVSASI